jgi:hypothetical protein
VKGKLQEEEAFKVKRFGDVMASSEVNQVFAIQPYLYYIMHYIMHQYDKNDAAVTLSNQQEFLFLGEVFYIDIDLSRSTYSLFSYK